MKVYDWKTGQVMRDASKAEVEAAEDAGGPVQILDVDGCMVWVVVAEPVGVEVES